MMQRFCNDSATISKGAYHVAVEHVPKNEEMSLKMSLKITAITAIYRQ